MYEWDFLYDIVPYHDYITVRMDPLRGCPGNLTQARNT